VRTQQQLQGVTYYDVVNGPGRSCARRQVSAVPLPVPPPILAAGGAATHTASASLSGTQAATGSHAAVAP
jgi:hypothetical protein